MSEKLGVDGPLGDGAAIDGYVFLVLPGSGIMDYLGEELLARAAFAGHEHRQVDRRHTYGPLDGVDEGRRVADYRKALFGAHHILRYLSLLLHILQN